MRTVQIYINDEILDLFDDENIEVSSSIQNINDIAKVFTDFSQQFTVPASPRNNEIFKHYYQNDVEDGFIAKERQPARIEINFTPFRRGKIQLEGAELVEGEAQHYSITFYGDVVTLKDLFGDDKLRDLDYSSLSFDGTYNEVKTSLTSGSSLDVRYPLITSDRVWEYGDASSNDISVSGNAIQFNELFPALRTAKVFELIEAQYGLTFEGNFLTDNRFTSLYTWWKNSNVFTAGKAPIQIPFTTYFPVQPDDVDYEPLENNRIRFKYIDVMQWEPYNDGTWTFNSSSFDGVISVTATNPSTQFVVDVHKNGDYEYSTAVQTGDIYFEFASFYQNLVDQDDYYEFFVRTNDSDTFVVSGSWFFRYSVTDGSNQTFNLSRSSASSNENIVSVTEIDFINTAPDMTVSEYFSGVLRMFNLTCYPTDENTFQIEPLEFWYSIGEEIDITEYTDVSKIKIDRPKLYNNIEFNWKESKSLLNVEYRENNNKQYGGLKNFFGYDGGDFKIDLPFETLLFSKFTGTNLQVGYSLETEPSYTPVIPKVTMLYFYPVSQSCSFYLTDGVVTTDEITNYYPFGQETFYNTTDYSINFNEEFSSLSLDPVSNSLYNIYYRAYLQNLFSNKARVVTVETNLPLRLLNSIQLNDALIIRDKKYRINLMKSQLTTGKVTLELITDIVTQPRTVPPPAPPLPVDGGDLVLPIKPIKPSKGGYWTIVPATPYPWITTTPVILFKQTGEVNVEFDVAANATGADRTAYYSVNFYDGGDNLYKSEPYVITQNGTEGFILQENDSLLLQENGFRIRI